MRPFFLLYYRSVRNCRKCLNEDCLTIHRPSGESEFSDEGRVCRLRIRKRSVGYREKSHDVWRSGRRAFARASAQSAKRSEVTECSQRAT